MSNKTVTPTTTPMPITPNMARTWLKFNHLNRPVHWPTVERYKRDMLAGLWKFTPASIGFDTDGNMIDGQHRLHAISQLPDDKTVTINVTHGLDPEAKFFIDQGRRRTPGNQLSMLGIKNYNNTAAAARFYLIWKTGALFRDSSRAQMITTPQVQEWVLNNMHLVDLANQSHTALVRTDARQAVVRAAFMACAEVDVMDAVKFFGRLHTGASLSEGNPILALRQRFETDRRTKRKRPDREQLGMIFTAWNYWRTGKSLKKLAPRDWDADTFPEPR